MKNILMIVKSFNKVGNKWVEVEKQEIFINNEFYRNILDSRRFFTGLGGYERHTKNYTCRGYVVTHINSISPDKLHKTTRDFTFDVKGGL